MRRSAISALSRLASLFLVSCDLCFVADVVAQSHPSLTLPAVIHECDINCNTLTLSNGSYTVTRHSWDPPNQQIVCTVVEFDARLLALHRTYPVDQTFRGQISDAGNSLRNITVDGKPAPDLRIAWGDALGSVPGSNEERGSLRIVPPRQINQIPSANMANSKGLQSPVPAQGSDVPQAAVDCDPANPRHVTGEEAYKRANTAAHMPAHACWTYVSAMQGYAPGQSNWGAMLLTGQGIHENAKEAFSWTKKAAAQGYGLAELNLAIAYEDGNGTAVDMPLAKHWLAKALTDPEAKNRIRQMQESEQALAILRFFISSPKTDDIPHKVVAPLHTPGGDKKLPNGLTIDEWNTMAAQAFQDALEHEQADALCQAKQTPFEKTHGVLHECTIF